MSIEFRLKYIRDAIDKNINEILLKWNARKVILNDLFDEDKKDQCPVCMAAGKQRFLKYSYVNMNEAVYKCESTACLYPFRNFKYKNYVDRTIFRYERIMDTNDNKSEKIFTSPTKIENDDIDHFNISWLDDNDLDSILTTPSVGQNCDIKDIINNICNDVGSTSTFCSSPSKSVQPSIAPTPKLSKCLQYIELLSPSKQSNSNKIETIKTPTRKITSDIQKVVAAPRPGSKHLTKKIRSGFKNNREIEPIQPIVEKKPLEFLDWLETVSNNEPKRMKEFELTSPAEYSESIENHKTNNSEKSSDPSDVHTTQPILIELMDTSESYTLDNSQLPKISKSCLLYQLDTNELTSTQNQFPFVPSIQPKEETTTQALINILSEDQDNVSSVSPNVERSSSVSEENSTDDCQIINTEVVTIKNDPDRKIGAVKKRKLKAKEQKQQEKKRMKTQIKKERNKVEKVNVSRKTFNIEVEEWFLGFDTVEPLQPFTRRKKELIWLKVE